MVLKVQIVRFESHDGRMVFAESLLADLDRPPKERLGLAMFALVP